MKNIAVVGGGLGGLCAALCFAQRGAAVTVYERAPAFTEVGAGIQVSANGLRILRALGLDPASALASRGVTLNDHYGRRVAILPGGPARETRLFHRAELLALLEAAVRAAGIEIVLGTEITPAAPPEADLIVAADGVKSAFRAAVAPDRAAPAYSGQVAWRAVVPAPQPIAEGGANVYMGPGRHMVVYPMADGRLINVVAGDDTPEAAPEGWQEAATREEMQARFADFGGPIPDLLARTQSVHRWGLYHHALPRRWSEGRVVLLGDAAHAMLPYLAQGACMAFEDAYVLARAVANHPGDLDTALGAYEHARVPRVARVMKEVRANATRFHHGNPVARFLGHGALRIASTLAPGLIARRFDWLYSYDAVEG